MATSKITKIIESGSNSYGSYIKFEDGTQICYGSFNKSLAANSYTEHLLRYPSSFANGFSVAPICGLQVWADPRNYSILARGTGQTEVTLRIGNNGVAVDVTIWWIAIARWKA